VNYFCVVVLLFVGAFLRHPLAFFAVGCAAFTTLCLNDSFSHAVRHAKYACSALRAVLTQPPPATASASCARRASCTRRSPPSCGTRQPRALLPSCLHPSAPFLTRRRRSNAPAGRPYSRSKVTYMCGQDRRLVLGGMYVFSGTSCAQC
jgi:hypothetical protein